VFLVMEMGQFVDRFREILVDLRSLEPDDLPDDLVVDIVLDTTGSVICNSTISFLTCFFSGSASVLCSGSASISCSDYLFFFIM